MTRTGKDHPQGQPHNYRTVALIIACGLFMNHLDATVLTTALPAMARDFEVPIPQMSIAITSYLLALAVFIPASGTLADQFGAMKVFQAAIVLFVLGSICCGLAGNLELMVVARFTQGMGGAMMVPMGRLVILRTVTKQDIVSAMSWLMVPAMIGPIIGPPLGGFIVTYYDWRWIFWLNLPIGFAGFVLVARFIPNLKEQVRSPFDFRGFIISALTLGCLLFGLELFSQDYGGWIPPALLLAGGIGLPLYALHARSMPRPILDVALMQIPTFRASVIAGSFARVTHGAQPFLLPLLMQLGFGYSAVESGLITLAPSVGTIAMKSLVPTILRRWGYRLSMIFMGVLSATSYAMCGLISPNWSVSAIFGLLTLCGFLMSFQFTALNTIAYADVPDDRMSAATGFYSTMQQLLLSFGVCIAALVLQRSTSFFERTEPTFPDFSLAFWAVAAISLMAVVPIMRLPANAGADMIRQTKAGETK